METVYLGTDGINEIILKEDDDNGVSSPAVDYMPNINRVTLRIGSTLLDSAVNPSYFDYVTHADEAKIVLKLGMTNIPAGTYQNCIFMTYDSVNDDGIVWASGLQFRFFDGLGISVPFDATEGGVNSNSYATVQEADAILNTRFGSEEWATLDSDMKAKLLISATEEIDGMPIIFSKMDAAQALRFPINDFTTNGDNGFAAAKIACIHQAMYLFVNGETITEALTGRIQGVRQEVISKIQKTTVGYNPMAKYAPKALRAVAKYADFGMRIFRS